MCSSYNSKGGYYLREVTIQRVVTWVTVMQVLEVLVYRLRKAREVVYAIKSSHNACLLTGASPLLTVQLANISCYRLSSQ